MSKMSHEEVRKIIEELNYGFIDLFDRGLCYDQDDVIEALRMLAEKEKKVQELEEEIRKVMQK